MRLVTMSFPLYGYMKKNLASKRSDIEKGMWRDILNGENITEVFARNEKRMRDYFGDPIQNIDKKNKDLSLLKVSKNHSKKSVKKSSKILPKIYQDYF